MVNTRSGYNRENRIEQSGKDRYFDEDDKMSVADHYTEDNFNNDIESDVRSMETDHEKHRIEQRFLEMNRQIGELTSIVRALTDKLANSREENGRDALNSETSTRSDTAIVCVFYEEHRLKTSLIFSGKPRENWKKNANKLFNYDSFLKLVYIFRMFPWVRCSTKLINETIGDSTIFLKWNK